MKRIILIIIGLAFLLTSCKSSAEREIEEYELAKAKLAYIESLIQIKKELEREKRIEYVDSLIDSHSEFISPPKK